MRSRRRFYLLFSRYFRTIFSYGDADLRENRAPPLRPAICSNRRREAHQKAEASRTRCRRSRHRRSLILDPKKVQNVSGLWCQPGEHLPTSGSR
ncbi:hypothetical protein L596_021398 [Steinernema carpocapsae]|uniref:Uncharacterized protein n=1 Tax=Steinernema carpocapsae TaxID=34508 RepID=A0A4U5MIN1_STECR|nr:hypothetical protein L596_021398 [Steinernema carpocapsae]